MENSSNGTLGFLMAKGPLSQIVIAFVMAIILYIILISLETIYISFMQVSNTRTIIEDATMDNTQSMEYSTNPMPSVSLKNKMFRSLPNSDNERTGIEYSYSCFLLMKDDNFGDNDTSAFRHIFHKGSESLYPLMGPGVFVNTGENSLRIYQNNTSTWYNYIDIQDIPIKKWFHLVILVKNNATEIYINGNLSGKITNNNAIIYQNYQKLYVFSDKRILPGYTNGTCPSMPIGETYKVNGKASGLISRFYYYSYALTYTEIQDLMNMGPNPQLLTVNQDKPPYFIDNWWTGRNMLM
jgi:hypothetical protein